MYDWVEQTKQQQAIMKRLAAGKYYPEGEGLEELLGLISIMADFCCDLQPIDMDDYDVWDVEGFFIILYANIDVFERVNTDYFCIYGSLDSRIDWGVITPKSVKLLIDKTYEQFKAETDFHIKVRHLIDLYKMGLVLMGLLYGNPR